MKSISILSLLTLVLVFFRCADTPNELQSCDVPATVKDLHGLDGCGWGFELENGKIVFPIPVFRCGTPPFPENETPDPLANFDWADGKKVSISFDNPMQEIFSVCMAGEYVLITCVSERNFTSQE
jgi:hypothetical protein